MDPLIEAELEKPVTGQELADVLVFLVMETVASLAPNSTIADEKLEDVASHFLTLADQMPKAPRVALLLRTTAQQLIQTEAGTG